MAVTTPPRVVGVPSRTLDVSSRVAVHGARSLESCRVCVGPRKHPRSIAAASTTTRGAPAVTQKAIDTMFQKDSAEQVGVTELEVKGSVPKWLEGDFYRTGPGASGGYTHWFDGLGMLVNFRFSGDGKVHWQQRFLDSEDYRMYRAAGNKPQLMAFKWTPGVFKATTDAIKDKLGLGTGVTDNAAVTFYQSSKDGSEGLAFTEAVNGALAVDRDTLATRDNISRMFRASGLVSAHPKQLPNGDHLNILIPIPFGEFQVFTYRLGDTEHAPEPLYNLKVSNPEGLQSWMHDLAMSQNYLAVVEQPLFYSLSAFLGIPEEYGVFTWKPEHGTAIRVMALDGSGEVRSFKLPALFHYHWVNVIEAQHAELGTCMCLDVFAADDPRSLNMFDLDKCTDVNLDNFELLLKRIWLPLEGEAEPLIEDLGGDPASYGFWGELSAIGPSARNNPDYRYIYAPTMVRPAVVGNQISKFDVHEKAVKAHWTPDSGAIFCEPQVVQRPGATAEDDGVVITPCVDGEGRCMVAVLDAGDLKELARAYTPITFPGGFHSAFMPPLATP